MVGNVTKMRGQIVARAEGEGAGWVANMTHPTVVNGLDLEVETLCLTRTYPKSPGSRTRISRLHCPDLSVAVGDAVVVQVETITAFTGKQVQVPAETRRDSPRWVEETRVLGDFVTAWGLQQPK